MTDSKYLLTLTLKGIPFSKIYCSPSINLFYEYFLDVQCEQRRFLYSKNTISEVPILGGYVELNK